MRRIMLLALLAIASPGVAQDTGGWEVVANLDSASLAASGWRQVGATMFTVERPTQDFEVLVTFWEGDLDGRTITIQCEESLGAPWDPEASTVPISFCKRPLRNDLVRDLLDGPGVVVEQAE